MTPRWSHACTRASADLSKFCFKLCSNWDVATHIRHLVKGRTSLVLPVRLGVKVHPVHPWWELLVCDQVVDLSGGISHSVEKDSRSSAAVTQFEQMLSVKASSLDSLIPICDLCPSPISCPLIQGESHRPSRGPLHSIQDFHCQGTLYVGAPMSLSQENTRRQDTLFVTLPR